MFLAPGVTGDTANTEVNGSQDRAKEVLVDGAQSTGPESGGTVGTYPPVEAIGEFKLQASNFSAEYGKTGGGFEIFTTKSGTNQYHGSLFEYLRNDKLDARGFISPITPVNRQNEFGANFGGPVRLPKYNGQEPHVLLLRVRRLPLSRGRDQPVADAAQRGATRRRLFGPHQGRACRWRFTTPTRRGPTARAVSRATSSRARASRRTASAKCPRPRCNCCPRPTPTQATANYTAVGATTFTATSYTIKGDHAFSDRNRISLFAYISNEANMAACADRRRVESGAQPISVRRAGAASTTTTSSRRPC